MRRTRWLFGIAMLLPSLASAQAWTPPAGSGSVNVVFQGLDNTGHLLDNGSLLPDGKSRDASVYLELEYAITNRLLLAAGLPYVFARYIGPGPTPGPQQPVDLCRCWHSGWQDVTFTAQYNVHTGPTGVTPFFAVGLPSHAYLYRGEAVVGRRLREARLGVAVGRRLDALSSRLSLQGTYSYAFVERVVDVPNNRSNATVEGAVLATRKVSVRGMAAWQWTHGGLRAGNGPPPPDGYPWGEILTAEQFAQHDRLLRDNYLHFGSGASWSLPRVDVFGSWVHFLRGTNSHKGNAFTLGLSYPFEWHPR